MQFPEPIEIALRPLFHRLPTDEAMESLVVTTPPAVDLVHLVEAAVKTPAIATQPAVLAGLWLYIDDLDRSHAISQTLHDATGAFWHGIMHRREGDFSNSHYWFHKADGHPVLTAIEDYDPHMLIDEVEAAGNFVSPRLSATQRREWSSLFRWCARQ